MTANEIIDNVLLQMEEVKGLVYKILWSIEASTISSLSADERQTMNDDGWSRIGKAHLRLRLMWAIKLIYKIRFWFATI